MKSHLSMAKQIQALFKTLKTTIYYGKSNAQTRMFPTQANKRGRHRQPWRTETVKPQSIRPHFGLPFMGTGADSGIPQRPKCSNKYPGVLEQSVCLLTNIFTWKVGCVRSGVVQILITSMFEYRNCFLRVHYCRRTIPET